MLEKVSIECTSLCAVLIFFLDIHMKTKPFCLSEHKIEFTIASVLSHVSRSQMNA